jgi:O-antigen/teichoic acid export membrane protein
VKRNLVTAFGAIAGSQVAILLVSTLFQPLLIRLIGFSTYGKYATVIAVFDLTMILVGAGINGGTRKYISEEHEDDNWESYVFAYYFRLAFVFALIGSLALVAAAKFGLVGIFLGPSFAPYFLLLALLALAAQFRSFVRRTLMGLKLEHLGEPLQVLFKISFIVIALSLAVLNLGVAGIIVAQIAASMLVFVVAVVFVSKQLSLKKIFTPIPDSYPKKDMFYFNYETIVYIFMLTSMYKIDIIMIGMFSSAEQAGYYRAALVLAELIWVLPKSLQSLLIQSTSDHWDKGRIDVIENLATRASRYVLLLTLLMAIGLAALAHVFVPIYYGANANPVITPLLILLPGAVGFALARPLLTINHSKGDMGVLIGTTGIAAVLNFVLNYLLIPRYGMVGAAISTTIGYGILPVLQLSGARILGYKPFKNARLGRIGATALLSGTVIAIMSLAIGSTTLADIGLSGLWFISQTPIALLIVPPAGFLLYALIAIATGAIDLGEIFDILVRIPGPVGSTAQPIKQRFEASEQFGNRQSRSSAIKLIFSLAAVIVIVSSAVMAAGFPLLAMTPLGTSEDGVLGPIIDPQPEPPTRIPPNNSTDITPGEVVTPRPDPTPTTTPTTPGNNNTSTQPTTPSSPTGTPPTGTPTTTPTPPTGTPPTGTPPTGTPTTTPTPPTGTPPTGTPTTTPTPPTGTPTTTPTPPTGTPPTGTPTTTPTPPTGTPTTTPTPPTGTPTTTPTPPTGTPTTTPTPPTGTPTTTPTPTQTPPPTDESPINVPLG